MKTEQRFLLAIVLMMVVLFGTNLLFPTPERPSPPEEATPPTASGSEDAGAPQAAAPLAGVVPAGVEPGVPGEVRAPAREVTVEGPRYRLRFSTRGARLVSAELPGFGSFTRDGAVDLLDPSAGGAFGLRLLAGADTVDLRDASFQVEPAEGIVLSEGGPARTLRFLWTGATGATVAVEYEFHPDSWLTRVSGRVSPRGAQLVLADLGGGLPFHEADGDEEARTRAFVAHSAAGGIRTRMLRSMDEAEFEEGPLLWAGFRNRYFVLAVLGDAAGEDAGPGEGPLGGAAVGVGPEGRFPTWVADPVGPDGTFGWRVYAGPQVYETLASVGNEFEEINAYGWSFFRVLLRPFVGIIQRVLVWMHTQLDLAYGWVLVVFGVLVRLLLWPLNQRAMRAQFRNMAVQPLLQDIQTRYKDNPERMQKELMKLYKEHGFNPLAGCLPMLIPFPVLIALFFVFQNTIEFRGVSFMWLPDLSRPDPFYILPIFLGISMFALQWVSLRSMQQVNPQMKFMMWFMPLFMVVIFFNFASGLNLYYSVSNLATLPQQWWIARERSKVQPVRPAGG